MKYKGSDLHLKVGLAPAMRLAGVLRQMQLPAADHRRHGAADVPAAHAHGRRTILEDTGGIDFAHVVFDRNGDETRFRVNLFRQRGRLSLVARRVNNSIPNFEGLGLPPVLAEIASHDQGIIILAGVTGSGKCTTIASMLQYVNERERMPHRHHRGPDRVHLQGRQVHHQPARGRHRRHRLEHGAEARRPAGPRHHPGGRDARPGDLQRRHARRRDRAPGLRDDPRLQRPVDDQPHPRPVPPGDALGDAPEPGVQPQGRSSPRSCCRRPRTGPRPPARPGIPLVEVMRMNPIVRKLILNEEDIKLATAIRMGKEEGMVDFTESLRQLVVAEKIERATAFEVAPNPETLRMVLKGIRSPSRASSKRPSERMARPMRRWARRAASRAADPGRLPGPEAFICGRTGITIDENPEIQRRPRRLPATATGPRRNGRAAPRSPRRPECPRRIPRRESATAAEVLTVRPARGRDIRRGIRRRASRGWSPRTVQPARSPDPACARRVARRGGGRPGPPRSSITGSSERDATPRRNVSNDSPVPGALDVPLR